MAFVLALAVVITACGSPSAEKVVDQLAKKVDKMDSYQAMGTMTLQTGDSPQVYDVEVWYKAPHHYRVSLSNTEQDITQIILRNDDGVFVLTPTLNKSFRFQSDWPQSNPQAYIYQSLVNDILKDAERSVSKDAEGYLFQVKANYQNRTLASQRILLRAKDFAPIRVEAMDTSGNVLMRMEFTQFDFNTSFDPDAFDMERNMTGWEVESVPTVTEEEQAQRQFGILRPSYLPEGVELIDESATTVDGKPMVILKYGGEYQYTITEQRPQSVSVSLAFGQPVDLGMAVGVLMEGAQRSLQWTYGGVDFAIVGNLPAEEMIRVAQSLAGAVGK